MPPGRLPDSAENISWLMDYPMQSFSEPTGMEWFDPDRGKVEIVAEVGGRRFFYKDGFNVSYSMLSNSEKLMAVKNLSIVIGKFAAYSLAVAMVEADFTDGFRTKLNLAPTIESSSKLTIEFPKLPVEIAAERLAFDLARLGPNDLNTWIKTITNFLVAYGVKPQPASSSPGKPIDIEVPVIRTFDTRLL